MKRIRLLALILIMLVPCLYAEDIALGYGIVYSLNPLKASEIDAAFSDIKPGGHTSFFYVDFPLRGNFSLLMTPGAYNVEDGDSQFHFQYNALSINYKLRTRFYPTIAAGLGGSIATLSQGAEGLGEVNLNGVFYKNSAFIWLGRLGLGYRLTEKINVIIEGRGLGFLENNLAKLNSYNIGMNIEFKI